MKLNSQSIQYKIMKSKNKFIKKKKKFRQQPMDFLNFNNNFFF
jgi:hypothetical protein